MPYGFDLGQYTADFSPLKGGPFVSFQDVLASFGDVFGEVINLLPTLVKALESITEEDVFKLFETGLMSFIDFVFPPDGSVSPIITGLASVLSNVATSGDIWNQLVGLVIQLLPQILIGMQSYISGSAGTAALGTLITLAATILTSNTALLEGFTTVAPVLQQLIAAGGGTGSTLADFGNLFTALASIAVTGITGLASGILPWLQGAGALPSTASLGASQLSGLASGLTGWLTGGGALPSATSLGAGQLTGLATGLASWLTGGGALPGGVTLPGSQLTGLATGILSWLTGGGALPSATTLGAGQLSGLATGIASWLTSGGALPAGVTAAASQLTGLASGIGSWLTGGGALPGGVTLPGSQLTGSVASSLLSGTIAAGLLPTITAAMTSGVALTDTLVQALGGTGSNYTQTQLQNYFENFSHTLVSGVLGAPDIGTSIVNYLNAHYTGLTGVTNPVGIGFANVQTALQQAMSYLGFNFSNPGTPQPNSVAAQSKNNNAAITSMAVSKPVYANTDQTLDASFDIETAYSQATIPTIALTQSNPVAAYITTEHGGQKQTVEWEGYISSGTLTGFYVNLYSVDATGQWNWVYTSPNYASSLVTGSSPQRNYYAIPALSYISAAQGANYVAELTVTGTGTYTMVGKTYNANVKSSSTAIPAWHGASRTLSTNMPTFVSVGPTFSVGSGSVTIDPATSANGAIFIATLQRTTNAGNGTPTINGVGMTLVGGPSGVYVQGGVQAYYMSMYYMRTPPSGAQTVNIPAGAGQTNINWIPLQLASVGTIGSITWAAGTSANPSQTIAAGTVNPYQYVVQAFAEDAGSITALNGYNPGQSAFNNNAYVLSLGGVNGSSSAETVSATNASAAQWGAMSLPVSGLLQPAPATVANPNAIGVAPSATRPASHTLTVPWIGLSGVAGQNQYQDVPITLGASGSIPNPAVTYPWANHFLVAICGDGSGGTEGSATTNGNCGLPGSWSYALLTRAQMGTSSLTYAQGPGGAGGQPGNGAAGSGSSLTIPGYGTINAAGGAYNGGLGGSQFGGGPGDLVVNDFYGVSHRFPGGAPGASAQAGGGQPGGAGAGGNVTWMNLVYGGPGGPGIGYIIAQQ